MEDKQAEILKKRVQAMMVEVITRKMKAGELEPERAKAIAQLILDKLSRDMTYEELILVIPKLDDRFEELGQVVVPIMLEYDRIMREEVNKKLDFHLEKKDFDQVLKLTKEAIDLEKQLT